MGRIGHGYGSEWHLLRYFGRHRLRFNQLVLSGTTSESVEWLDFGFNRKAAMFDDEPKGLEFLADNTDLQRAWADYWPLGGGVPNWDAVGRLARNGRQEWLLVEAKAHVGELRAFCQAKAPASRQKIEAALRATKSALGVDSARDWMASDYYQLANRLAVLHFLNVQKRPAKLLLIYFTGDTSRDGRVCPPDAAGWEAALETQDVALGLQAGHPLAEQVHKLFLPVCPA